MATGSMELGTVAGNLGAGNITTTGSLSAASGTFTGDVSAANITATTSFKTTGTVASTGVVRLAQAQHVMGRNSTNNGDRYVLSFGYFTTTPVTDAITLGGDGNCYMSLQGSSAYFGANTRLEFDYGGAARMELSGGALTLYGNNSVTKIIKSGGASPFQIYHEDDTTNSATGQEVQLHGQNCTGTTTTGGAVVISSGTGTTANGAVKLRTGSTVRVECNATGIGFFAATPVAKPTVTGSRGANAALASLLTQLASLGLITDSSSA